MLRMRVGLARLDMPPIPYRSVPCVQLVVLGNGEV